MHNPNTLILQTPTAWQRFAQPRQIVVAQHPAEVPPALQVVETAVATHHLHAAGYLAYEAGAAFGLATHPAGPDDPPLLWFGLYDAPEVVPAPPPPPADAFTLGPWQPGVDAAAYAAAIARIKAFIAAGHTYQVNYTFPVHAPFAGDAWALFCRLAHAQQAAYTAYLDLGRHVICSASPELFFQQDGRRLLSKPMKGTAARGRTLAEERANADWLHHSEKNRAENVMIVDMIRNDIGRIAATGSVQVPALFAIERYPTLLQMTSTVTAETTASLGDILAAMFPCASITGAPKKRTMDIIAELEAGPRGVYTGAIGCLAPDGRAQFNVAIRTAIVDRARGQLTYGVGSGITWDSDAAAEYAECGLKTRVLAHAEPPFQLLESLLWTPAAGCFLRDAHLARLAESAEYFGFKLDETAVRAQLQQATAALTAPAKLRL
ncbi:MAG: aminodeoxychorismate synthase component I, partial [Anaerolineales bacterium]|nr:aminodeoxychorismate synthase component I [Anaerolineales bacterium]